MSEYLLMEFIVGARKWYVSFYIFLHPVTSVPFGFAISKSAI
jgi:hypothetical protein